MSTTTTAPRRVRRATPRVSTHTTSYRADRVVCSDLSREQRPDARWVVYVGSVTTPHGMVTVQSFLAVAEDHETATFLRFVHDGRAYSRILNGHATTTQRAAAIAAGRLVRDVVAGRVKP